MMVSHSVMCHPCFHAARLVIRWRDTGGAFILHLLMVSLLPSLISTRQTHETLLAGEKQLPLRKRPDNNWGLGDFFTGQ